MIAAALLICVGDRSAAGAPKTSREIRDEVQLWPEVPDGEAKAGDIADQLLALERQLPVVDFQIISTGTVGGRDAGVTTTFGGTEGNGYRCFEMDVSVDQGNPRAGEVGKTRILFGPEYSGALPDRGDRQAFLAVRANHGSAYLEAADLATFEHGTWTISTLLFRSHLRGRGSVADELDAAARAGHQVSLKRDPSGHSYAIMVKPKGQDAATRIFVVSTVPFMCVQAAATLGEDGTEFLSKWVEFEAASVRSSSALVWQGLRIHYVWPEQGEHHPNQVVDSFSLVRLSESPNAGNWVPSLECLGAKSGTRFVSAGGGEGSFSWLIAADGSAQLTEAAGATYEELQHAAVVAASRSQLDGRRTQALGLIVAGVCIVATTVLLRIRKAQGHRVG